MTSLDRRSLLKAATLTGGLAVMTKAYAQKPSIEAPLDEAPWRLSPEMAAEAIDSFDERLSWIDERSLPGGLLSPSVITSTPAGRLEGSIKLIQKSSRSLYAAEKFLSLPDELKAHPKIQERMITLRADMDDAVSGMLGVLERLSPADHKKLQSFLRHEPEFAERVMDFMEEPLKRDGPSFWRRAGLRSGFLRLSNRMATSSPSLVTDALISKVQRASSLSHKEQVELIESKLGKEKFFAYQQKMAAIHDAWKQRSPNIIAQPSAIPNIGGPMFAEPNPALVFGSVLLFGLAITSVVAGIVIQGTAGLLLGLLLGPVLLLAGVVVLLASFAF